MFLFSDRSSEMGKGYFLHLPILVLFFTLGYGYDPNKCLPRKCGNNNGPQISFPFRLKNMPPECGQPGFELLCTTHKGETALEIPFPLLNATLQPPFPVKFFIESIDYEYQEIVISRVDGCLPQLLPILNLSASPFSFKDLYDYEYLDDYSIFNCSTHRNITDSIYITPIACLTKPGHFIYAMKSYLPLNTVTELISCTKTFNISVPYFIAHDNTEFSLSWTEPSRGGTGPLTKLKVAGEVLGSFLVVVIVLVTYRIYRSNKMKKEDQVKIERFLEDYKALKPARYSYADIKKITDRFSEKSIVSMTAARGTMGYIAPEVFSRNFGNVSYKSDVYSFGMLLLEMVGGRKKSDISESPETSQAQDYFPDWIYNILNRGEEVEIQIEKEEDSKIAKKLTIVGLWCIQWYPVDRPSIKVVIQMLEAEEPPSMPPNPFTSTDPSKAKANKPGKLFTSGLEIISELE